MFTYTRGNAPADTPFRIGYSAGTYLNGFVSQAMVYNRALSSSEVLSNFNALKIRHSINTDSVISTSLIVNLDAAQYNSYSGTGTTWTNLGTGSTTYNTTLISSPTFLTSSGGYFRFDGTTQYATLTRPVYDDFTLGCWFSTTSSAGSAGLWWQGCGLMDCEFAGSVADFGLSVGAGRVLFGTGGVGTTAGDLTIASTNTYNDGKWHYAVATRNKASGQMKLYVDGLLVAGAISSVNAGISLTANPTMYVGRVNGNLFFAGNIAWCQAYTIELTSDQIIQNYNVGRARFSL